MNSDEKYQMRESALSVNYCDRCNQYCIASNQVQTIEGEWICPVCKNQCTCQVCGTISEECEAADIDGDILLSCQDCKHEFQIKNPPTVDMVSFAHNFFGYKMIILFIALFTFSGINAQDTIIPIHIDSSFVQDQHELIGAYVKWCELHPIVISTRPAKSYNQDRPYEPMTRKRDPDLFGYYEWLGWLLEGRIVDFKISE